MKKQSNSTKFKAEQREQMLLLPPSIDDFVSETHLSRFIHNFIDECDCSLIENQYSEKGQKSHAVKLMFKILLYGYCTGTYSGRKLAAKCQTDIAYMFLTCMHQPDFITINDFRKDNIDFFKELFLNLLIVARHYNLAQVGQISVDGSKIRANASVNRTKDKEGFTKWRVAVEKTLEELHAKAESINAQEDQKYGAKSGEGINKKIMSKIKLKNKINSILKKYDDEKLNPLKKINLTDEDAELMKSNGRIKPNYNCQGAVGMDGVMAAQYVTTCTSDKEELQPIVEAVLENTGEQPSVLLADSGYASYDSYEKMDNMGVTVYMPDQDYEKRKKNKIDIDPYDSINFIYDKEKDCYTCQQGHSLPFNKLYEHKSQKQKARVYKCASCDDCPFRKLCTNARYRTIHREEREHLRQ